MTTKRGPLSVALAMMTLLMVLAPVAQADPGKARLNYLQYCSGCHQMDGTGLPASDVPSMRGTLGKYLRIAGGREYIVQVPGVMNSPLRDSEIADLMNWLLPVISATSLPDRTAPYTAEEIGRLRQSRPVDILDVRRHLQTSLSALDD